MKVYADTTFLISLYSPESNSAAAAGTMKSSRGDHYITIFGELKVVNAFELRVFRKELTRSQADSSLKDFEQDLHDGVLLLRPSSHSCRVYRDHWTFSYRKIEAPTAMWQTNS